MRKRFLERFGSLASGLVAAAALALAPSPSSLAGDSSAAETQTVTILDAAKSGDLAVTVRGAGESHVKFTIENKSGKRLNVVIPPGLVAASSAGQGFQSMGLGVPTDHLGGFGAFRSGQGGKAGFRSITASAPAAEPEGVAISPGQTLDLPLPSVCLNYGLPTPSAKNVFRLMSVEEFTPDARVRRALTSLATLGTSQTVAQVVMWHVANGMTFDQIGRQTVVAMNSAELAQAARFVEALDGSSGDVVDPAYFQQGRILVRVQGDGSTAKDARRLASELSGVRLMGLPIAIVDDASDLEPRPGTLFLNLALVGSRPGLTAARVGVRTASATGQWQNLGGIDNLRFGSAASDLTGEALASDLGRALARSYVSVSVVRRTATGTTFKVVNRLPMTIAHATLKAGKAGDPVRIDDLGIAPARSATASLPAASAAIDSVELNGL